MNRIKCLRYYFLDVLTRRTSGIGRTIKSKMPIEDGEAGNDYLRKAILSKEPFATVRPGMVEVDDYFYFDEMRYWPPNGIHKRARRLRNAFNSEDEYEKYEMLVRKDISEADAFFSFASYRYLFIHDAYMKKKPIFNAGALCPLMYNDPWTKALEGKKVLVVSVFSREIEKQFSVIERIFPEANPWPEMELMTVQSVWFSSVRLHDERFKTYFEALEYLYEESMKRDFEVALLCCSYFAIDLAPRFKKAGKIAIQMGGDMQLMFGIRGRRWDDNVSFSKYYNDYWIRPDITESGANKQLVDKMDGGCYW